MPTREELVVRVLRARAVSAELHLLAAAAITNAVSTVSDVAARHGHHLCSPSTDPAALSGWPAPITRVFTVAGMRGVRDLVQDVADRAGAAESVVPGFVLAVQELMTNAIRHGGGWGRVRLHRDGHLLICAVTDRGPGMADDPERFVALPDTRSRSGRGLFLARSMSDGLRIITGTTGVTVTITMNLPAPGPPGPRPVSGNR